MQYYEDFARSTESLYDRMGDPTPFDAAVGILAINFSRLEDTVRNIVLLLSGAEPTVGHILVAELSFRQKLDVMSSLIWHRLPSLIGEAESPAIEEQLRELVFVCRRAEELRNTYLHSSYVIGRRAKLSAKAKHGLRVQKEDVDAGLVFDVADWILGVACEVEFVPTILGIADVIGGGADYITYLKNDVVVATFKFGEPAETGALPFGA